VPENEDEEQTKAVVRHLYTEVKTRVAQLARNDPNLYRKIFNDFDLSGTGNLTIDEITNMIAKLQISVERKFIYPFFKIVDANNSGTIEFEEFEAYLNQ
jgi:Ca2+-binding EF-hand superfamily protein